MGKDALSTKVVGNHPKYLFADGFYHKVEDLRYGTNPSQTAALYAPGMGSFFGSMAYLINHLYQSAAASFDGDEQRTFLTTLKRLKTGKEGPSQTNIEDVWSAASSVMYFDEPTFVIIKHTNASGFATQYEPEPLVRTFRRAFDADFRAAFGGTLFSNREIDLETTDAMREQFVEVVVAPEFDPGVVGKFEKTSTRIFKYDPSVYARLARFAGDKCQPELKKLQDGSLIRSDPLLFYIKNPEELGRYVVSRRQPTDRELLDMHTGLKISLKSNSIRFVKDGCTHAIGTGQQDRVMCIDIADYKNRRLVELFKKQNRERAEQEKTLLVRAANYAIPGSVLVSDGFLPFTDSIDLAHDLGSTAVLAPHGGDKFEKVLARADDHGMAFVDLPGKMRIFKH